MNAAKRPAHGVRDNRSPMQAPARARSIGRCAPHDFRAQRAQQKRCIYLPAWGTERSSKMQINHNFATARSLDFPVDNVTWNLARRFCGKLNQMISCLADYRFDLPTEAQWEYACRAGTTTALNSGKNITHTSGKCVNLAKIGWYEENGIAMRCVGKKKPNAWGLYDMHGNVEEWCRDWYEKDYASDPEFLNGQKTGVFRVTRGGGHRSDAENCRSASRECYEPTVRYNFVGFRLALVPVK